MISTTIPPKVATICTRALLLSFLTFYLPSLTPASAQTAGQISIGGKVYGGGKEGAILTGNTTNPAAADAKDVTLTVTDFTLATAQASQVTINATGVDADAKVQITAVFGGGEQGRAYGKTNVTVNGGTIGVAGMADSNPNKPVNGNAFGAGDGQGADVLGGTHVLITAGTINGSVYGGGNQADLVGSTELTLQGGKYVGAVFGGAKQADIWGHTFVNVDGANAKNDLHIIDVYGGNDIAGNIRPTTNANWSWAQQANLSIPTAFTLPSTGHLTKYPSGNVTSEWNAFVYASKGTTYKTLIDNIYGGGNGDYGETNADGVYTTGAYAGKNLKKPVIDRTYLQIEGGMYGSLYGGGNAATVAVSTDICLVNTTDVSDYLGDLTTLGSPGSLGNLGDLTGKDGYNAGLDNKKLLEILDESASRFSADYQFNRVFGGNNKEPMAIRPNWYLEKGTINNLYSGGNAGAMTYYDSANKKGGILITVESDLMEVNNVYGGCRMADVDPGKLKGSTANNNTISAETLNDYDFEKLHAARVLIKGGDINNVYGGNDVSGNVYYGSQVEIHSSINGNVYGAGNGSYAYTDNINLKGDKVYGDYYYDGGAGGLASAQALSIHRPNAAQSYVHVKGTESKKTYIGGAIYCGGNSATLRTNGSSGSLTAAKAELHIGSYVIADNVFLGSNGENMVKSETANDLLQIYKNGPVGYSAYAAANSISGNYSSLNLIVSEQFEEYMRGVEVAIKPTVTFDADYVSHSTKFGSLYCGGNVGSMSADGYFNVDFLQKLVIYNKLVGGCNNANVAKTDYNAFHMGGLTGEPDANKNKVLLTIAGLQLEPRVLTGNVKSGFNLDTWNYVAPDATNKMLIGGNIYGGCYSSGYINGGVNIDIQQNAISPDVFTSSGVTYEEIRDDVLASTLACYGGGYGKETEIWGNVTVSITGNGQIMKAYGGGEMGVVGKLQRNATTGIYATTTVDEWYPVKKNMTVCTETFEISDYDKRDHTVAQFTDDGTYNTTVNLNATLPAGTANNVAKLYAGGFQGTVSGNTTANLNRGRAYDAFGGASNADILGHAETYIGKTSAPTITHNVYGANDFGGLIVGEGVFYVDNNKDGDHEDTMEKILTQTYVEYAAGKIGDGSRDSYGDPVNGNVFGGPCGAYDYADSHYTAALAQPGFCKPMLLRDLMTSEMLIPDPLGVREHVGYAANSFVNVTSQSTLATDEVTGSIFGAGQGMKGHINSADERGSYVRLMAATTSQRKVGPLSPRVYGAGYCSNTGRSLVDAHTGYFGTIFGAAHGISYEELTAMQLHSPAGTYETNYMGWRSAVRLYEMTNEQMDIYGGGANAGAQEAGVVLYGGQAHDVYGGQYDQGITYAASVDVPATSTSKVNAIFGGARGKGDEYPCDVFNTYVTWRSADARVKDAIYGGNNNARMTRNAYISINQPVKNYEEQLTNVFGGGYGEKTVTLYTEVGLHDGAQVANAYGGGNNGKVLDTPSFRYYLDDGELACSNTDSHIKRGASDDGLKIYPSELKKTNMTAAGEDPIYGFQKYILDTEVIGFHEWIKRYNWTGCHRDGRGQPLGSYEANDHGHPHDLYFLSTQMDNVKNTHVIIEEGATVAENVYGGGLGEKATVSGETSVQLLGGIVRGDIYGGGKGGHVEEYPHLIHSTGGEHELTMSATNVDLGGGSARNVYGGGLNGNVTGSTNVILGSKDMGLCDYAGTLYDGTGGTVAIAREDKDYNGTAIFRNGYLYAGDPVVERSLYGGGEKGAVFGTAYLTINQGHVGYKYNATAEVDAATRSSYQTKIDAETDDNKKTALQAELAALEKSVKYVENLDLNNLGDNYLDQNGNAFGAGYGEGATVDVTYVNLYGGTIRNSLYGGGEIAAVGQATMTQTGAHPQVGTISVPGRTHIYMYNGLVRGDVFGGGRGYSYDLTGNEVIGKEFYTDGYVFGTTDVEIRGGVVGTPETVEEGHGNVFGGGNIGYCFTDAVKHGTKGDKGGEGRYYTNAWKCTSCGHIDYEHDMPEVCGHCHKSTNATDTDFQTSFTQVDINGVATSENEKILSEDCRVIISPWAQVIADGGITIKGNGKTLPDGSVLKDSTFAKGAYVPTDYLDLLRDKNTDKTEWAKISDAGVTVRNAVFAGGNVSSGSDKVYANAYTVFGNATASINDVFFRDMVSIGTEHIGGLYGDGNLTFVDGYRELNITNYGTDYYGQQDYITLEQYNAMNDRERAYFELEFQTENAHDYTYRTCLNAHNFAGVTYVKGQQITPAEYSRITTQGVGPESSNDDPAHWSAETTSHYEAKYKIKESEYDLMTADEQNAWTEYGFCSIYAGRLLNTIQRADFCGVFGSRMVLQGAQDRVPEVVDYTQYTINRVGELSLNQDEFQGTTAIADDKRYHGNYIGFYNVVNYLGALTSDVAFDAERTYDNTNGAAYAPDSDDQTFYQWKDAHQNERKRNNGTCHNMVALASGVYLELVNEPTTNVPLADVKDPYKKDWGYITGIVQLDLINVMPGLGGGYVYAKAEHGARSGNAGKHENLSIYNKNAVNNSAYTYNEGNKQYIETSGNFIHNVKQIVDDCYPAGGSWNNYTAAPAHYWYIRGEIYVYDQYISAFTGSTTAYTENINLPLTITAGANGRLDLIDIKPNYYAYYKEDGATPLGANDNTVVNNITYGLNDVITYWDYMQLNASQKAQFVPETYVCVKDYCTTNSFDSEHNPVGVIKAGEVLLPSEYAALVTAGTPVFDPEDITQTDAGVYSMKEVNKSDLFHISNAVSHENGYVLDVSLSNPVVWDNWYSPNTGYAKMDKEGYKAVDDKTTVVKGPTYYTTTAGLYGQREYKKDDIITGSVVNIYTSQIPGSDKTDAAKPVAEGGKGRTQATVAAAYVAIAPASYTYNDQPKNVQEGVAISYNEYASSDLDAATKAKFAPAYTCTSTYEVDAKSGLYIYYGELISDSRRNELITALTSRVENPLTEEQAKALVNAHFDNAYIVTSEDGGWYGGQHFEANKNYEAIDTWATLSADDRQAFKFRYDALDVLGAFEKPISALTPEQMIEHYYPGTGKEATSSVPNNIHLYDGPYWEGTWNNTDNTDVHKVYGAKQPIDYEAEYRGTTPINYSYTNAVGATVSGTIAQGDVIIRETYESLLNEQRHYSHFNVKDAGTIYIVKTAFVMGNTPYKAGRVLTADEYSSIGQDLQDNNVVSFNAAAETDYYICREPYRIENSAAGHVVHNISSGGSVEIAKGQPVSAGVIISGSEYEALTNQQKNFTVHGESPIETSTFYVNRESDIYDLSKERIITIVYQYKYEESDESGKNIEEITERHVVNIHIEFKSGVPTIGQLQEPAIVLPGDAVGLKQPNVTPGAYELLGGGWELFTTPEDAAKHQNGKEYINSATPMYWYQDGYYVAYYAKTYLGKTYSNAVQFKVANYHDIADVMQDPNFMYIDNPQVHRNSKIYISDSIVNVIVTPADPENDIPAVTTPKSEIDLLYDLFHTSLITTEKTIQVDVQDKDGKGNLLYYAVDGDGNFILVDGVRTTTPEPTAFPVTHKEPAQVPVFNDHVRNLANLDFFLSEDVSTAKDGGWESIGNATDGCYMGTLHGMGHTISGLNHSLFGELCGYVYNLGVTGSFVESGVADRVAEGIVPDSGDPDNSIEPTHIYGYVNSSWIYTSAGTDADDPQYETIAQTRINNNYRPVVGDENDFAAGLAGMHVHNCYYPEECNYPIAIMSHTPNATANSATLKQFNNGEVAYDLNGWYLNKRYQDKVVKKSQISTDANGNATGDAAIYKYWRQDENGDLIKETNGGATEGYYIAGGSMHAYNGQNLGYVERLFADGDFVYRNGTIPLETNERYSSPDSRYAPIWPDDYYFFGQMLTYGYDEVNRPYQPLPSMIRKTQPTTTGAGHDSRLLQTKENNMVYRIPAYFRSKEKRWAHFNPNAVFADHIKEGYTLGSPEEDRVLDGKQIHSGLTALDFTGFNDRAIMVGDKFVSEASILDVNPELVYSNGSRNIRGKTGYEEKYEPLDDQAYFGPITDYTTLMSFETHDITQNLLAYAPTMTYSHGTANTLSVLRDYFNEPDYSDYYDKVVTGYRTVEVLDASKVSGVKGHVVMKHNQGDRHYYYAPTDHFLVDAQDFNAPIKYEFPQAEGHIMWYQRTPDNYADMDQGWEGVSLPFAAELVTTQDKGEITHFYNSALGADYAEGKTSGHEYWLREFTGVKDSAMTDPDRTVTTALMNYPVEGSDPTKTVTNTFLWDYYYNADGKDANDDDYRHEYDGSHAGDEQDRTRYYYGQQREYANYPLSVAGKPYIAGFPGGRYYEFDLSGTFVPEHTSTPVPAKLAAQTITFVSNTGITIRVSDDELADAGKVKPDGSSYTFHGNYLNVKANASTYQTVGEYNAAKGTSLTEVEFSALTPLQKKKDDYNYYVLNSEGSAFDITKAETEIVAFRPYFSSDLLPLNAPSIAFTSVTLDKGKAEPEVEENRNGNLRIWAADGNIYVVSESDEIEHVRVSYVTGVSVASGLIQPGEMLVFPIAQRGIYLVNTTKVLISL